MVQIIKKISLEVSKPNLIQAIVAKQYDNNSRFLQVTLMHEGKKIEIAPTSTVIINAKRTDGEEKSFAGEANYDGTATVPLTYWMLELEGEVWCDVSVIDTDGRKLTSTKFDLLVERASCNSGDVAEDENYDVLVKLIEDVNKAKAEVNGIKFITEQVNAHELDYGMYIVDNNNGGQVLFDDDRFSFLDSSRLIFEGIIFVYPVYNYPQCKSFTVITLDVETLVPITFYIVYDADIGGSGFDFEFLDLYASQRYVDEQIKSYVDEVIGGIVNGSY